MRLALRFITLLTLLSTNNLALAAIAIGEKIPSLSITQKGELVLENNKIVYQRWNTDSLNGKVHILQYLAGRMSASKVNKPFTDKLDTLTLSLDHHHVTTIINLSDTFFATSGFVNRELQSNKKQYPQSSIVADKNGSGASTWDLKPESSAIFILSPKGTVLFFKDGALTQQEIEEVVTLMQQEMKLLETQGLSNNR